MNDEELDPYTAWVGACSKIAWEFAEECAKLRQIRPEPFERELEHAINYLMTEFWDRNYSQTEIRTAFLAALDDMPRYAAGFESRSEEARAGQRTQTSAP